MAKPSNGISQSVSALSRRSSGNSAPWMIANIACGESPRAARLRAAQRWVMLQRRPRRGFVRRGGHALVQRHHDVAADGLLRLDAQLGAEQDRPAVEIALEDRARLGHRARMRQRENLEAAGIGQHGALPAHEPMDAAQPPEDLRPRAQQQVIGIGEQDLRARILQRLRKLRLDRGLRAHRHEERRPHLVVQGPEARRARPRAGGAASTRKLSRFMGWSRPAARPCSAFSLPLPWAGEEKIPMPSDQDGEDGNPGTALCPVSAG